jgi:hypothetical protein
MVNGVARVEAQSPLSLFDERNGLAGSVSAIARHDGVLYAGTTTGLYRLRPAQAGRASYFEALPDISEEVQSLLSTGTGLLVGGKGVYQLQGKKAKLISKGAYYFVYDLSPSKLDRALVYDSGSGGLPLWRVCAGSWSDGGQVPAVNQALRKAIVEPSGVWLGTDLQDLLLVSGLPDNPSVETFGARMACRPARFSRSPRASEPSSFPQRES